MNVPVVIFSIVVTILLACSSTSVFYEGDTARNLALRIINSSNSTKSRFSSDVPFEFIKEIEAITGESDITLASFNEKFQYSDFSSSIVERLPKRRLNCVVSCAMGTIVAYEKGGRSHTNIIAVYTQKNNKINNLFSLSANIEIGDYQNIDKIKEALELRNFLLLYNNGKNLKSGYRYNGF